MTSSRAIAWSIGSRLTARHLENWAEPVATSPLTIPAPDGGFAVLFRFGVVCAVGMSPTAGEQLLRQAKELLADPRAQVGSEDADLVIATIADEGVDTRGRIVLRELSAGRAQVVASVLAKSAVLGDYEGEVAAVFERIEPFATQLKQARLPHSGKALLRELGDVLLIQSRMVGRAEISEKPDITWEMPELDRLYDRLAVEFELREREQALTRKLELIQLAANNYLNLLNSQRTLRVEWYIVFLIFVEILLILYELAR
jgi:uncharacterized Rmd1/YagE family protein